MSAKALELLEDVPEWYRDDPNVQALFHAQAKEIVRYDLWMRVVQEAYVPSRIGTLEAEWTTVWGAVPYPNLLAVWETWLKLPVNPVGTLTARRTTVVARLRERIKGGQSGLLFQQQLQGILPGATYNEFTLGAGIIKVMSAYTGSEQAQRMAQLRKVTPAHLAIIHAVGSGFILGESQLGVGQL